MNSAYPYTKDIKFDTKIAEISSISLEHELNIEDTEINGNFIVEGEYKSHEISVNKESFSYKLPFSVDVTDNIDKSTIDFEITDFTYEVIDENTLRVNIEFFINAQEIEIIEESEEEEEKPREDLSTLFIKEEDLEEKETEKKVIEEQEEVIEDKEEDKEPIQEERLDKESENIIMDGAKTKEVEFTTYNIHIVKETDTIDSICTSYNTDVNYLKEYNNLDDLKIGDKLIIPVDVI